MKQLFATCLLVVAAYISVYAQSTTDTTNSSAAANTAREEPPRLTILFKDRLNHRIESIRYGAPFSAEIKKPTAPNATGQMVPVTPKPDELVLIINNRPFPEYPATQVSATTDSAKITFIIDHHKGTGTNLAKYLDSDRRQANKVYVEIGKKDGNKLTTASTPLTVIFYTDNGRTTVIVVGIILVLALLILAWKSNLLKDKVDNAAVTALRNERIAAGQANPKILEYRWSLAKTQLALWTLVIAILYFLIWIISESTPTTNTTVLALLGIAFGTTAAAALKPSDKKTVAVQKSNFLLDLVDDGSGASIHRFQNVVFIIVFLCIFIGGTYRSLEFPEFDATQLLLLGISSAGYVGMKFLKEGN